MKKENIWIIVLVILLALAVIALFVTNKASNDVLLQPTDTESSIVINREVNVDTLAVQGGIIFEPILAENRDFLDQNATGNHNGIDETDYIISLGSTSTVGVVICMSADGVLTDDLQGDIPISPTAAVGDEKWSSELDVNNYNNPAGPPAEFSFSTSPQEDETLLPDAIDGTYVSYRFWLDVDQGFIPGNYNNTIRFNIYDEDTFPGC